MAAPYRGHAIQPSASKPKRVIVRTRSATTSDPARELLLSATDGRAVGICSRVSQRCEHGLGRFAGNAGCLGSRLRLVTHRVTVDVWRSMAKAQRAKLTSVQFVRLRPRAWRSQVSSQSKASAALGTRLRLDLPASATPEGVGEQAIAATVFAPAVVDAQDVRVLVCWPGGSYGRRLLGHPPARA